MANVNSAPHFSSTNTAQPTNVVQPTGAVTSADPTGVSSIGAGGASGSYSGDQGATSDTIFNSQNSDSPADNGDKPKSVLSKIKNAFSTHDEHGNPKPVQS